MANQRIHQLTSQPVYDADLKIALDKTALAIARSITWAQLISPSLTRSITRNNVFLGDIFNLADELEIEEEHILGRLTGEDVKSIPIATILADYLVKFLTRNSIFVGNSDNEAAQLGLAQNQLAARLSGDLIAVNIQNSLAGLGVLITGQMTITDTRITANSWAVIGKSEVGTITGDITFKAVAGSMEFTSDGGADDGEFGYQIFI